MDAADSRRRLLLVTAHPDDECMFFLPSITHYQNLGYAVSVLCLSTGNADGLGYVRKQELFHACSLLGIKRKDVVVMDDPYLCDGLETHWPREAVAAHVRSALDRIKPSLVLTFDSCGVSGHKNHIATSHGVCGALSHDARAGRIKLQVLVCSAYLFR